MSEHVITNNEITIDQLNQMTIKFKPDATGRPSKSGGNNMVVASTGGFIQVGDYKVSINVIKRKT